MRARLRFVGIKWRLGHYDANRGVGVLSPTADSATWWSPVDVKNAGLNVWEPAPLDRPVRQRLNLIVSQ